SGNSFELTDGTYSADTIKVQEFTSGGEALPEVALATQVTVDSTNPVISLSTELNQISGTTNEAVTLTFDYNGDDEVDYTLDVAADSSWSVTADTLGLTDNDDIYTVDITATDIAGNSLDNLDVLLEVDTVDPTLDSFSIYDDVTSGSTDDSGDLSDGDWTNDNQPTFEGTTESGASVSLTIADETYQVTAADDGAWSITLGQPLDDGNHDYSIDITDSAGNSSDDVVTGTINVDTTPPSYDNVAKSDDGNGSSSITFDVEDGSGGDTSSENSGISSITALLQDGTELDVDYDYDSSEGTATVDTSGVDSDSSADVVITITDVAGNETQVDTDI
ncbi:Ig-like domain-containing protein, partial [Vibrio sp. TH_r3]|uniref:Ig-like domain-containing protein n=1 Tax=Vibrio sp. TH_r3 TaxID=3082084 RepID=UPI002955544F